MSDQPAEMDASVALHDAKPAAPPARAAASYRICAIREVAEAGRKASEGFLYPVALDRPDEIALEARDGDDIKRVNCTSIKVMQVGSKGQMLRVREIRGQVLVTDARITVACSKYDKGGGWWGTGAGAIVALPLNVGSHALAAHRRRGKMLVGQVRYPWIESVWAQNKAGFRGAEALRVIANAGGKRRLRLDLQFPKNVDATAVARELIQRAAAFRLEHDDQAHGDEEREKLIALTHIDPLLYDRSTGKMAGHQFPSSWPASDRSASFGLRDEETGR
jgi:hypothetical protein